MFRRKLKLIAILLFLLVIMLIYLLIYTENQTENVSETDIYLADALRFVKSLSDMERRVSAHHINGPIGAIFERIGEKTRFFVEIGANDGRNSHCLTWYWQRQNWRGLLMDKSHENITINLRKALVTETNIVSLFERYSVPFVFDLFIVNTNFKDFWLINALLDEDYRPRIIVSRINLSLRNQSLTVPQNDPNVFLIKDTNYSCYSVTAGWHLARKHGYSLIYCESNGLKCIYVIDGPEGFGAGFRLSDHLPPNAFLNRSHWPYYSPDLLKRPMQEIIADSF